MKKYAYIALGLALTAWLLVIFPQVFGNWQITLDSKRQLAYEAQLERSIVSIVSISLFSILSAVLGILCLLFSKKSNIDWIMLLITPLPLVAGLVVVFLQSK